MLHSPTSYRKLTFTQIKESCIYINDIQKTKSFYHDKLGLELISQVPDRHIFFRAGQSVLLCFLASATKKETTLPPHYGKGNLHFAFETTPSQYQPWKDKIRKEGIIIEYEHVWPNNLQSFYFRDPDHHLCEIITPGLWD